MKTLTAAMVGVALLSTPAVAQERQLEHAGYLTAAFKCYHLATAAGLPEAQGLLLRGDQAAARHRLNADGRGQVVGYTRAQAETAAATHGSALAAFNALGCQAVVRAPVAYESLNQRIPPGTERR